MTPTELQQWLCAHGQTVAVDGKPGPQTRAAIVAAFTNTSAAAVTDEDIDRIASRLKCSILQLRAVAQVESGGSAFDKLGRPKILFERHLFHRLALQYPSPIEMAYSTVTGEAAHYEMLARYVEHNGLAPALRQLSTDPETCRDFAAGYNGPGYRNFDYHTKLARALR
jgi:hypothetical protein